MVELHSAVSTLSMPLRYRKPTTSFKKYDRSFYEKNSGGHSLITNGVRIRDAELLSAVAAIRKWVKEPIKWYACKVESEVQNLHLDVFHSRKPLNPCYVVRAWSCVARSKTRSLDQSGATGTKCLKIEKPRFHS